jgi:hypothetical protein
MDSRASVLRRGFYSTTLEVRQIVTENEAEMTYIKSMVRIALITSAVAIATICGGIGLSMAHSAINSLASASEDGFSPPATFMRAQPLEKKTSLTMSDQRDDPMSRLAMPLAQLEDAPASDSFVPVTQQAIERQGFGSFLAPRIGQRPQNRPYAQISSAEGAQALVISSPMHTSQRASKPRPRVQRALAPVIAEKRAIARRIDGGRQNGSLIGVFR